VLLLSSAEKRRPVLFRRKWNYHRPNLCEPETAESCCTVSQFDLFWGGGLFTCITEWTEINCRECIQKGDEFVD
jgi:hypothetical protein